METRSAILDVYNLIPGASLFASLWLVVFAKGLVAEDAWISGALIVLIALVALVIFTEWKKWLNLTLGLWIAASPWVLGFTHTTAMHVGLGVGLFVAFLSAIELWVIR